MYNAQILSFPFNLCTVPPGCRGAAAQAAQATQAAQAAQAAHAHRAAAHSPNVPRAGTNWGKKCRCTGIDSTFAYLSTCNVDPFVTAFCVNREPLSSRMKPHQHPSTRLTACGSWSAITSRCVTARNLVPMQGPQTHQDFDKD